jgi:hypothetical protein
VFVQENQVIMDELLFALSEIGLLHDNRNLRVYLMHYLMYYYVWNYNGHQHQHPVEKIVKLDIQFD